MEAVIKDDEINELNSFLELDSFDIEQFDKFFQPIKTNKTFKFKLIDFEYYCEKTQEEAKREKKICITQILFEKAQSYYNIEKECERYIDFKREYNIDVSLFYCQQDYLWYFYFGTSKNDKFLREYFNNDKQ